jgi:hypothetical protein
MILSPVKIAPLRTGYVFTSRITPDASYKGLFLFRGHPTNMMNAAKVIAGQVYDLFFGFGPNQKITLFSALPATQLLIFFPGHFRSSLEL